MNVKTQIERELYILTVNIYKDDIEKLKNECKRDGFHRDMISDMRRLVSYAMKQTAQPFSDWVYESVCEVFVNELKEV